MRDGISFSFFSVSSVSGERKWSLRRGAIKASELARQLFHKVVAMTLLCIDIGCSRKRGSASIECVYVSTVLAGARLQLRPKSK